MQAGQGLAEECSAKAPRQLREEVMRSVLLGTEEGPVVVTAVDAHTAPLLLNWFCGRYTQDMGDARNQTLVVATVTPPACPSSRVSRGGRPEPHDQGEATLDQRRSSVTSDPSAQS